jgi:hypothetical protein
MMMMMMMKSFSVCGCLSLLFCPCLCAIVALTGPPGYNHGGRQAPHWPLPDPTKYTTFMAPSKGHLDTTWCKALVLDDGYTRVAFVTIDAIGKCRNVCSYFPWAHDRQHDQALMARYATCRGSSSAKWARKSLTEI